MSRHSTLVGHGQLDPTVIWREAGAPDDHVRLQCSPFAQRAPVLDPRQAAHALDACISELARPNADQWIAVARALAKPPAQPGVERKPRYHWPYPVIDVAPKEPAWECAGLAA